MIKAFLGALDDEEFVYERSIMLGNIFEFEFVIVVLFEILDSVKGELHVLSSGCATLCSQISDGFSLVDFSDAFDGESPEYFFADHYQNFTFIHSTSVRNKRKGYL